MSQYGQVSGNYYLPKPKFNSLRGTINYIIFFNSNILTAWCILSLATDTNLFTSIEQEYIARDTRGAVLFNESIANSCIHLLATDSSLLTSIEQEYIARDTRGAVLFNELIPTLNHCYHSMFPEDPTPTIPTSPVDDSVDLYQITINSFCTHSLATDTNLFTSIEQEYIARDTRGVLFNESVADSCTHALATDTNLFTLIEREYIARDTRATLLYNEIITNSCEVALNNA